MRQGKIPAPELAAVLELLFGSSKEQEAPRAEGAGVRRQEALCPVGRRRLDHLPLRSQR